MNTEKLGAFGAGEITDALKAGQLALYLGPFVTSLKIAHKGAIAFFQDMYRDCPVSLGGDVLADYSLALKAPNRFRRYVRKQIVPDPGFYFPSVPLPAHMAPLALEMGLNLCVALQCFRHLIFHAGVVEKDGAGVMIAAASGGGKSTLTAALMQEGARLLSDEFAILDMAAGALKAYPRPVSLKNTSIDVVSDFAGAGAVGGRLTGTPKGAVAYRRARDSDIAAMDRDSVPKLILFPKFTAEAAPKAVRLEPADAAMQLIASSPNYHVIGRKAFDALMTMMDGMAAYELEYGSTEDSLGLVDDLWREHSP